MKVAILAGGLGSRLAEETVERPKPMVEVGGKPVLWHIIKMYAHYGFDDFVVALGYKGDYIKRWMADYASLTSDVTIDMRTGGVGVHRAGSETDEWRVSLIETGQKTGTGGRIKRLGPHLGKGRFALTWGDGVSDLNISDLIDFHKKHGKLCTLTAVRPPARFGHLELDGDQIVEFSEKPQTGEGWINGAFFVCEPEVLDYIDGDETMFEKEPLERLAKDGQLMAYQHPGFWQCMDTIRDRNLLEKLWESDEAPWKVWS
jgi:glucose-1-phosphate cytidylyltransferase